MSRNLEKLHKTVKTLEKYFFVDCMLIFHGIMAY